MPWNRFYARPDAPLQREASHPSHACSAAAVLGVQIAHLIEAGVDGAAGEAQVEVARSGSIGFVFERARHWLRLYRVTTSFVAATWPAARRRMK